MKTWPYFVPVPTHPVPAIGTTGALKFFSGTDCEAVAALSHSDTVFIAAIREFRGNPMPPGYVSLNGQEFKALEVYWSPNALPMTKPTSDKDTWLPENGWKTRIVDQYVPKTEAGAPGLGTPETVALGGFGQGEQLRWVVAYTRIQKGDITDLAVCCFDGAGGISEVVGSSGNELPYPIVLSHESYRTAPSIGSSSSSCLIAWATTSNGTVWTISTCVLDGDVLQPVSFLATLNREPLSIRVTPLLPENSAWLITWVEEDSPFIKYVLQRYTPSDDPAYSSPVIPHQVRQVDYPTNFQSSSAAARCISYGLYSIPNVGGLEVRTHSGSTWESLQGKALCWGAIVASLSLREPESERDRVVAQVWLVEGSHVNAAVNVNDSVEIPGEVPATEYFDIPSVFHIAGLGTVLLDSVSNSDTDWLVRLLGCTGWMGGPVKEGYVGWNGPPVKPLGCCAGIYPKDPFYLDSTINTFSAVRGIDVAADRVKGKKHSIRVVWTERVGAWLTWSENHLPTGGFDGPIHKHYIFDESVGRQATLTFSRDEMRLELTPNHLPEVEGPGFFHSQRRAGAICSWLNYGFDPQVFFESNKHLGARHDERPDRQAATVLSWSPNLFHPQGGSQGRFFLIQNPHRREDPNAHQIRVGVPGYWNLWQVSRMSRHRSMWLANDTVNWWRILTSPWSPDWSVPFYVYGLVGFEWVPIEANFSEISSELVKGRALVISSSNSVGHFSPELKLNFNPPVQQPFTAGVIAIEQLNTTAVLFRLLDDSHWLDKHDDGDGYSLVTGMGGLVRLSAPLQRYWTAYASAPYDLLKMVRWVFTKFGGSSYVVEPNVRGYYRVSDKDLQWRVESAGGSLGWGATWAASTELQSTMNKVSKEVDSMASASPALQRVHTALTPLLRVLPWP